MLDAPGADAALLQRLHQAHVFPVDHGTRNFHDGFIGHPQTFVFAALHTRLLQGPVYLWSGAVQHHGAQAKAMQGMLADGDSREIPDIVASAYMFADAMLKAREAEHESV